MFRLNYNPSFQKNKLAFNLDSKIGHEIMRLLRKIAKEQGRSVVIVSHDPRIKDIADRVLWLEDGQFKEQDAAASMEMGVD